jgi:hypothetical protein
VRKTQWRNKFARVKKKKKKKKSRKKGEKKKEKIRKKYVDRNIAISCLAIKGVCEKYFHVIRI